jgi:hypothetical protein
MKILFLLVALLLSFSVNAQTAGIVERSDCEVVAKSDSVAGNTLGRAGGSIAGAVIGGFLFGSDGANIGGALGGVAGGVTGSKMGESRTYRCLLKVQVGKDEVFVETLGKLYNTNQAVVLVKMADGQYKIRP